MPDTDSMTTAQFLKYEEKHKSTCDKFIETKTKLKEITDLLEDDATSGQPKKWNQMVSNLVKISTPQYEKWDKDETNWLTAFYGCMTREMLEREGYQKLVNEKGNPELFVIQRWVYNFLAYVNRAGLRRLKFTPTDDPDLMALETSFLNFMDPYWFGFVRNKFFEAVLGQVMYEYEIQRIYGQRAT